MCNSFNRYIYLTYLFVLLFSAVPEKVFSQQAAVETKVVVRALAKDAKFIGTGMGGAYVIIKDHQTKEVLAKGYTLGSSGDTPQLMEKPRVRHEPLTTEETAKFEANISLTEPTFVDVEVLAPVNRKHATVTSATQLWLIPGKHIDGDGIILEIPGLVLDILYPHTHEVIPLTTLVNGKLLIKVHLVMMCGCVIKKEGIWDADHFEVTATIKKEGVFYDAIPLQVTDKDNLFDALLAIKEPGNYELVVQAFDKVMKNTGVDKISFVID